MEKELKSKYYLTYNPCQPSYQQAGKHYIQLDYSGDCELGKYISEIFEVESPKTSTIPIIPDGCNDIIITSNGENVTGWLSPSIQRANFVLEVLNGFWESVFCPELHIHSFITTQIMIEKTLQI